MRATGGRLDHQEDEWAGEVEHLRRMGDSEIRKWTRLRQLTPGFGVRATGCKNSVCVQGSLMVFIKQCYQDA